MTKGIRGGQVGVVLLALAALFLSVGCERLPERAPKLSELDTKSDVKRSGRWLVNLDEGFHRLDESGAADGVLDVAVHGYDSRGYEWVHGLKRFGELGHRVYWYRWNWNVCPEEGAKQLTESLGRLLAGEANITKIRVFGHSYGGVITALMASGYQGKIPMEAHLIASPLAGMGRMKTLCGFKGMGELGVVENLQWFQWRTQHALDGAFRDEEIDPQVLPAGAGQVTRLPQSYEGRRLGHNWSISWVVDQLATPAQGSTKSSAGD